MNFDRYDNFFHNDVIVSSLVTNLDSSKAQKIVNWVKTAGGCVHAADTTQLDFAVGIFVETRRDCRHSATSCEFRTHRQRDSTRHAVESRRVGGVYWTLEGSTLRS